MKLTTAWIYVVTEENGCVAHVKVDDKGRYWLSILDERYSNHEIALVGPYHHKLVAIERARRWQNTAPERADHRGENSSASS